MARQSRTDELFETVRTRVTSLVSEAATAGRSGAASSQKRVQGIVDELRKLADELESRLPGRGGTSRTEAAKKAARTRASNATKRSASAKKAAATRKRTASSSSGTKKAASATRKAASATRKAASSGTRKASSGGTRKSSSGTKRRTTSRAKKS